MRRGWTICLVTLLCTAMGGCNQMGVKQNASSAYEKVRDQFSQQQAYAFYGRTKLLTANSSNANVVNFSGRKDGDALYMNVKLSAPEQNRVDTLSLLHQGNKLYAKTGSDKTWKSAAGQEAPLMQELNNWNPDFCFQQMDEMKTRVLPVVDENPGDDVEAVRVVLDSAKLKSWLASQLKEQTASRVQSISTHQPKVKLALSLSEGNWKQTRTGASIQSKTSATDVSQIVDGMDLEADYTVYYRKSSMLPISMVMSIDSHYDLNDQRVQEHSQVETFLQNYGQVKPLPKPAGSGHPLK